VGALVMGGLIRNRMMMMMVLVYANRHVGVAQDNGRGSVDRRDHETRWNEGAQE
jgi:hypothetical protein